MPHIIIEYSDNLEPVCDFDGLVTSVHRAAASSPIVPLVGLRTRAVARSTYCVADGDDHNAFVAVVIRLGPGRTDSQKLDLADLVMDLLSIELADVGPFVIAFSVECQEIDHAVRRNKNQIRAKAEQEAID